MHAMDAAFCCQVFQMVDSWYVWVAPATGGHPMASLTTANKSRFAPAPSTSALMPSAASDLEADFAGRLVTATGGQPVFVSYNVPKTTPVTTMDTIEAAVVKHIKALLK